MHSVQTMKSFVLCCVSLVCCLASGVQAAYFYERPDGPAFLEDDGGRAGRCAAQCCE